MRIYLVAVPPGRGEAKYILAMEVPAVPRVGDYVTVMREYKDNAPKADYKPIFR